ncbi:hypothetical protein [Xanthomonas phage X1]|nr:hypothetical protein [Xanthomonas phage X1]
MTALNKEAIDAVISLRQVADDAAKSVIKELSNKAIPFKDRWAAYKRLCKEDIIFEFEDYGCGELHMLVKIEDGAREERLHDLGYERYQAVEWIDLYESIFGCKEEYTEESFHEWRESILKNPTKGLNYDW